MAIENIMDWPAPKYGFGQRVRLLPEEGNEAIGEGLIVGMTYRSPLRALKAGKDNHGWIYSVSIVDAMPINKVVSFDGDLIVELAEWSEIALDEI